MRRLFCSFFAAALLASPAAAVDFNTRLTQIDGKPFTEADGVTPEKEPTTLRRIVVNSLLANYPDESNLSGEIKLARFDLAKKVQESKGDLELTAAEASTIKTLMLKGLPIVVVGQAVPLIEASVRK